MKVLQICNKVPFPPKDGGSLATWNLAKGLAQQGVDLTIAALNTSKHQINNILIPEEYNKKIRIQTIDLNTDIRPVKLIRNLFFSKLPYNLERFQTGDFAKLIVSLLSQFSWDIILLEGTTLAVYLPVIRKHTITKVVMRAHNVEHMIWKGVARFEKSPLKKKYFSIIASRMKIFETKQLSGYDALLPISEADSLIFRKFGFIGPVNITPFGIEMKESTNDKVPGLPNDLIYIGALDWLPNLDGLKWFIEKVWTSLHNKFPGLQLHIAGRNPSKEIRKMFSSAGIHFYGEVENTYDFLNKGSIMIVPLFAGSGMRVKIIEGMAAGKCLITTEQGIEGISATPGKHILVANQENEFKKCIESILIDPEKRNSLRTEGQKYIRQNFNNFVISEKLVDFFNSIIK